MCRRSIASSPDFDLLVMAKTRSAVLGDLVVMYSLGRFLCRPGTQRRWERRLQKFISVAVDCFSDRAVDSVFFHFLKHYYCYSTSKKGRSFRLLFLQMWSVQPKLITQKKSRETVIPKNFVKSKHEKSRENDIKTFNDLGGNGLGRPFGWHRGGGQ